MSTAQSDGHRRGVLLGVAIGVLLPAAAFLLVARADSTGATYRVGSGVWALVAFTGTLMIGFDRTRRIGLGILLGFSALILVGAGTCTAAVFGGFV